MLKFNLKYFSLFLLFFIFEVIIALFVHDNFIRPFVGDILVVILIYFFIKSFVKKIIKLLPLYIFIFALCIEICQYFNLVKILGFENNILVSIVLGSTFDLKDILCYFIGSIVLFIYQIFRKD